MKIRGETMSGKGYERFTIGSVLVLIMLIAVVVVAAVPMMTNLFSSGEIYNYNTLVKAYFNSGCTNEINETNPIDWTAVNGGVPLSLWQNYSTTIWIRNEGNTNATMLHLNATDWFPEGLNVSQIGWDRKEKTLEANQVKNATLWFMPIMTVAYNGTGTFGFKFNFKIWNDVEGT